MPIEEIKQETKQQDKPLLNIQLPVPNSGNPNVPLSVGQHNASAKKNFEEIANVMLKIINNQKMIGLAITEQDRKITELTKLANSITENLRKLLKDKSNDTTNTTTK